MIGISVETLENWENHGTIDRRKGASKKVPRKLSEQGRQQFWMPARANGSKI